MMQEDGEIDDDEEDCEDEDEDEDDEEDGEGEGLRTGNHADGNGEDTDESAAESDTDVPDFVGVGRSSDATSHVPWRINVWHRETKKTKYLGAHRSKRGAVLAAIKWRLATMGPIL